MELKWPGINAKGTVLIDLAFESFLLSKVPVLVDSIYYMPKDELHVTLVGEEVGSILQHKIKLDPKNIEVLVHIFECIDWAFNKSGPIHILSRSKKSKVQKSIIMLIDMPGMTTFYQQLKSFGLIPDKIPIPPAHVTLYTYNCPLGIGVPCNKTLRTLSKKTWLLKKLKGSVTNEKRNNWGQRAIVSNNRVYCSLTLFCPDPILSNSIMLLNSQKL